MRGDPGEGWAGDLPLDGLPLGSEEAREPGPLQQVGVGVTSYRSRAHGAIVLVRMEDADLATYAKGMAGALRVIGPASREQVLGMLAALHLLPHEQRAVVDYALANGILSVEGDDLRAVSQSGSIQVG